MSSIMNGYMNSIERENDIFERSIEIEYNKISLMIEAYRNKLENDYLLAEQKIMMENGTYEDLTYLYTEANNEADKNKEGIFARIKKFIQGIIERIKNFFRGGDENIEGNAPAIYDEIAKQCNSIVDLFNNVKNAVLQGKWGEALKLLGNGAATLVVFKIGSDAVDATAKKAEQKIIFYSKNAVNRIKKIFNKTSNDLSAVANVIEEKAESSKDDDAPSLLNDISKQLGKAVSFLTGKFNELKKALTKNNQSEQQEQKEETPKEKPSEGEQQQEQQEETPKEKPSGEVASGGTTESNEKKDSKQAPRVKRERKSNDEIRKKNHEKFDSSYPALTAETKKLITSLVDYQKAGKLDSKSNETNRINYFNNIMKQKDEKKINVDKAYKQLYPAPGELIKIFLRVSTDNTKKKNYQKSVNAFYKKYQKDGTITESYDYFDDYDLFYEYSEIDNYDYDEIDRVFTEYTGDSLMDDLIDIFKEF